MKRGIEKNKLCENYSDSCSSSFVAVCSSCLYLTTSYIYTSLASFSYLHLHSLDNSQHSLTPAFWIFFKIESSQSPQKTVKKTLLNRLILEYIFLYVSGREEGVWRDYEASSPPPHPNPNPSQDPHPCPSAEGGVWPSGAGQQLADLSLRHSL